MTIFVNTRCENKSCCKGVTSSIESTTVGLYNSAGTLLSGFQRPITESIVRIYTGQLTDAYNYVLIGNGCNPINPQIKNKGISYILKK